MTTEIFSMERLVPYWHQINNMGGLFNCQVENRQPANTLLVFSMHDFSC